MEPSWRGHEEMSLGGLHLEGDSACVCRVLQIPWPLKSGGATAVPREDAGASGGCVLIGSCPFCFKHFPPYPRSLPSLPSFLGPYIAH